MWKDLQDGESREVTGWEDRLEPWVVGRPEAL